MKTSLEPRGDCVEDLDPETLLYRYQSDFDLIIVTETSKQANKIEQNNKLNPFFMESFCS